MKDHNIVIGGKPYRVEYIHLRRRQETMVTKYMDALGTEEQALSQETLSQGGSTIAYLSIKHPIGELTREAGETLRTIAFANFANDTSNSGGVFIGVANCADVDTFSKRLGRVKSRGRLIQNLIRSNVWSDKKRFQEENKNRRWGS